ncbi:MAG: biopolymer transporter ExbD [Planctomycetes bacterium]|nr:biopolymer transporter ExbD [Planctomycetota bacterium]
MARRRRASSVEIGIAPLIDLVFILLLFFLVGASFQREPGIDIERPRAVTGQPEDSPPILVAISPTGTVHMEGHRVPLAAVESEVRAALQTSESRAVMVLADVTVPTGLLVQVMDFCRQGGAARVLVGTKGGVE